MKYSVIYILGQGVGSGGCFTCYVQDQGSSVVETMRLNHWSGNLSRKLRLLYDRISLLVCGRRMARARQPDKTVFTWIQPRLRRPMMKLKQSGCDLLRSNDDCYLSSCWLSTWIQSFSRVLVIRVALDSAERWVVTRHSDAEKWSGLFGRIPNRQLWWLISKTHASMLANTLGLVLWVYFQPFHTI